MTVCAVLRPTTRQEGLTVHHGRAILATGACGVRYMYISTCYIRWDIQVMQPFGDYVLSIWYHLYSRSLCLPSMLAYRGYGVMKVSMHSILRGNQGQPNLRSILERDNARLVVVRRANRWRKFTQCCRWKTSREPAFCSPRSSRAFTADRPDLR